MNVNIYIYICLCNWECYKSPPFFYFVDVCMYVCIYIFLCQNSITRETCLSTFRREYLLTRYELDLRLQTCMFICFYVCKELSKLIISECRARSWYAIDCYFKLISTNAGSNYNSEYLNLMQLQAKLFFERISGTLLFRASFIKILRHVTPGLVQSTFTH